MESCIMHAGYAECGWSCVNSFGNLNLKRVSVGGDLKFGLAYSDCFWKFAFAGGLVGIAFM